MLCLDFAWMALACFGLTFSLPTIFRHLAPKLIALVILPCLLAVPFFVGAGLYAFFAIQSISPAKLVVQTAWAYAAGFSVFAYVGIYAVM